MAEFGCGPSLPDWKLTLKLEAADLQTAVPRGTGFSVMQRPSQKAKGSSHSRVVRLLLVSIGAGKRVHGSRSTRLAQSPTVYLIQEDKHVLCLVPEGVRTRTRYLQTPRQAW